MVNIRLDVTLPASYTTNQGSTSGFGLDYINVETYLLLKSIFHKALNLF